MSVPSSLSPSLAPSGRAQPLARSLADSPTLHHALLRLLELVPGARFVGLRREHEGARVFFRVEPGRQGVLALDAEANGALRAAHVLDEAPDEVEARRAPPNAPPRAAPEQRV